MVLFDIGHTAERQNLTNQVFCGAACAGDLGDTQHKFGIHRAFEFRQIGKP